MATPFPGTPKLGELLPPLSKHEMLVEANRCLYCYDAPCLKACPTHIDVPKFIRQLATDNPAGAAHTIFEANLLGATCARVCPVAQLCEGACVLGSDHKPIAIGRLQRFAMDSAYRANQLPSASPLKTGFRVAVVGSGPAGLSCAGELARRGHEVTVLEAGEQPGGLSTTGIVTLREPLSISLSEVEMIKGLGVTLVTNHPVRNLRELRSEFDAVFLAVGLGGTPHLGVPGEEHITDGLAYIKASKLDLTSLPKADSVLVIGGGNTAIDCAIIAQRLGASRVTILYRRKAEDMPAYPEEQALARAQGVEFRFETTLMGVENGVATCHGQDGDFALPADLILRATGQTQAPLFAEWGLETAGRFLVVDSELQTNMEGVFAGGDCIRVSGPASTVAAVEDGKTAAAAIHRRAVDLVGTRSLACPI